MGIAKKASVFAMLLLTATSAFAEVIDLSTYKENGVTIYVNSGDVLKDSLQVNAKVSIAKNAKVTLDGAIINGLALNLKKNQDGSDNEKYPNYTWAGITCEEHCEIILAENSVNYVSGFYPDYPGIFVPSGFALTISGSGSLTSESGGKGAGIGSGVGFDGGRIVIKGGNITATGGEDAAGIGSANGGSFGSITIEGGTVTAVGGENAAGIGGADGGSVGKITIEGGAVTAVGYNAPGIGSGEGKSSVKGVTIKKSVTHVVASVSNPSTNRRCLGKSASAVGSSAVTIGDSVITAGSTFDRTLDRLRGIEFYGNTILYDANGGIGEMESQSFLSSGLSLANFGVTLRENTFTHEKLRFSGWNTEPDGSGQSYPDKAVLAESSDGYQFKGGVIKLYAQWSNSVDLSQKTGDYVAQDGDVLFGSLSANVKVSIAAGAQVKLDGVVINGVNDESYPWAGLTCEGDCKIVLAKGSKNVVKGFYQSYPGIYVPEDHALTITGSGELDASSNGNGAGIGGGDNIPAGSIVVLGGTITATGGQGSAGIGGGSSASIESIDISESAKVIATKGGDAPYSVGIGKDGSIKGAIKIADVKTDGVVASPFKFPETYTVFFVNENASESVVGVGYTFYRDVEQTINAYVGELKGYNFVGWTTAADGSGTAYAHHAKVLNLAEAGETVTLYAQWMVPGDLSKVLFDYVAQDGEVLTDTLKRHVKISIAAGAKVTLNGAVIISAFNFAGITCEGDCEIVLAQKNVVSGSGNYPGIYVPESKTLTIKGSGELVASNSGFGGAGIGGGSDLKCGNIVIEGGVIEATGGIHAAGIGGGSTSTIGDITITKNVTKVTATKGNQAPYSIGCGEDCVTSGIITIAGEEKSVIVANPFTYPVETFTVVFDANGGSGERKTQTLERGWEQELEANTFTRDGYTFIGWNTKANGHGKTYADQVKVENLAEDNGKVILYAQWYKGSVINLASLKESYTAKDGDVLTGSLAVPVKISIADKATVTLHGVAINGVNDQSYKWAGITCEGDCGIVLADGSENIVTAFYLCYPGIYVPEGKTLTISGSGSLDVSAAAGQGIGAGIGAGVEFTNNNDVIPINAGNIVIAGGTVRATGGMYAAGIGSATASSVGYITITDDVTKVIATRGENAYSIGRGLHGVTAGLEYLEGTRTGDITIGGVKRDDIDEETFVYPTFKEYAAVQIAEYNGGRKRVVIDGEYTQDGTIEIESPVEVDAIEFNRELTPKVPATTMLPFTLPKNATVNAEFYELTDVVEVDHSWRATMTNIKKLGYNLPKPNTPYAVILNDGESDLEFDLKGEKAVVQTGDVVDQWNVAGTWYFTSSYAFKDWGSSENADEIGLVYAFSGINDKGVSKGVFGRVSTESTANPLRSYLRKKDESVMLQGVRGANGNTFASTYSINLMPEIIDIEFVDSDANGKERTTAIGRMNPATGEIRLIRMDRTFDLKGRSVGNGKKARGVYYRR